MMTKSTSKKLALVKKIGTVPILAGLIYFFCIEVIAQEKAVINHSKAITKNNDSLDKKRDAYYAGVRIMIKDNLTNTVIDKMYEELTLEEKRTYLSYVPKAYSKKSPTEKELNDFKNSKKYAIWIDGNHVSNSKLNNYKTNKIAYFSGSSVLKNARSKKFPQPFQYSFYTNEYFEKNLKNSHLKFSGDTLRMSLGSTIKTRKNKNKELVAVDLKSLNKVKINGKEYEQIDQSYVNEDGSVDAKGNPQKKGYIKINNNIYFYLTNEEKEIEYYNRWGLRVDEKGEKINVENNYKKINTDQQLLKQ